MGVAYLSYVGDMANGGIDVTKYDVYSTTYRIEASTTARTSIGPITLLNGVTWDVAIVKLQSMSFETSNSTVYYQPADENLVIKRGQTTKFDVSMTISPGSTNGRSVLGTLTSSATSLSLTITAGPSAMNANSGANTLVFVIYVPR